MAKKRRVSGSLHPKRLAQTSPPQRLADRVYAAFEQYVDRFSSITRKATFQFESRDWRGLSDDALARLGAYGDVLDALESSLKTELGDNALDKELWVEARNLYGAMVGDRLDAEIASTFFNSMSRRMFDTVGVDESIEFTSVPERQSDDGAYHVYGRGPLRKVFRSILMGCRFSVDFIDSRADAGLISEAVDAEMEMRGVADWSEIHVANQIFFRGKGAYVIGRIVTDSGYRPLAIAIHHARRGLEVSAVLVDDEDMSVLFSYTQTAFHVLVPHPAKLVAFLRTVLPNKAINEVYSAIGFTKHGKSELYRELIGHLRNTDEQFVHAPGVAGMVMIVFTLPSHRTVIKIIRDRFPYPKQTTRTRIMDRYRLVFRHDRAGRLIDAQEFEQIQFDRDRFSDELLAELKTDGTKSVTVTDTHVVIHHAYIERKVTPLDIYIRSADPADARRAVIDYGTAIKNLAASGIFPGDMLLKNFGVTRFGRVVFYDYDELASIVDCSFRVMPEATHPDDEMNADAWFGVGEGDVFPEELSTFLGLPKTLRAEFEQRHGDLFGVEFWTGVQDRLRAGEMIEIYPFRRRRRLHPEHVHL